MAKHPHSPSQSDEPITIGQTVHWARYYDLFVFLALLGRDAAFRRRTADLARIQPGERILDVGCGTGDLAFVIEKRVGPAGTVVGIDAASEMITRARQKAAQRISKVEFLLEPIESMSFAEQSFDVVVSSMMFHHLPPPLKESALGEIRRVLKPGGRVLIVDASHATHHFFPHPALQTGVEDLPPLLEKAGFLDVSWQRGPLPFIGAVQGHIPFLS